MFDMRPLNRRQFLALGVSSASAVFLASRVTGQSLPPAPNQYVSKDGLLDIALDARYEAVNLAGEQAYLYSYNGQIPAPQLEAKPGDSVRIRFTNNLPQPTNIHYHGLHVPPTGNADNIFLNIPSGETFTYEFTIPDNHPGGTFYYHPHLHGWVAEQVFAGLGGAFIIRGELDAIPEIQAAQEVFLFLKDFDLDANGRVPQPWHMAQMMGREGSLVTANGQVNPTLSIPKGGLLRLRLVNASTSRFYRLALEDHPLYLIATDGIPLSEPVELRELLLTPGERAEILVRGEREPNQYRLLALPYNRGGMGMMGGGMMGRGMMGRGMGSGMMVQSDWESTRNLATLTYAGQVETLPLPQKLIPVETLPEPQRVRRFILNHGMSPGMGMVFLINGRAFDHQRVDTQVSLNTIEDWEITNTGVMDHPFHLHTNPFQVISRNGQPESFRAWKDTVLVRAGETVRFRVRFTDFPGKTVYHCHILDHEDLGMMGTIEMQKSS
ncbi:putative multicopper oxidase [Xenococcus sp. PCC 7305]|nr:putative multicopper oxidase [Xenococcus sp. PCC 7305]